VGIDEPDGFATRAERLIPPSRGSIVVELGLGREGAVRGSLSNISISGLAFFVPHRPPLGHGSYIRTISVDAGGQRFELGAGTVVRFEVVPQKQPQDSIVLVALEFDGSDAERLTELRRYLVAAPWVTDELREDGGAVDTTDCSVFEHTMADFYRMDSPDLFYKCAQFYDMVKDAQQKKLFQALYRVTLTSGLDHRITVFNPISRCEQEMICYDSNSYLNLHRHPRVIRAVKRVLDHTGFGTPSAQLLGGTNRYLRELEETISRFHGRNDTVVFPSGYAANVGTMSALVREHDLVVRDRFSHASIHDGCQWAGSEFARTYPHMNMKALQEILAASNDDAACMGRLIVSDGVFSMHGRRADLPGLLRIARRNNAKLMIDEAHATGIVGATGRGLEEHFGLEGDIDILMGTFSKAPGSVGGYVCGSRELVYYLRFYAHSAMFTASLPAPICAGVTEAFRIMDEEPWHRERLWKNVHTLVAGLREVGYSLPDPESGIITVFVGSEKLLWLFSLDLFREGIKAGNVSFPAVPKGEAIIRLTLNAAHTERDLDHTIAVFEKLGKRYGILNRSRPETSEIGERLVPDEQVAR
jgi:glycine C-acetyltransferase